MHGRLLGLLLLMVAVALAPGVLRAAIISLNFVGNAGDEGVLAEDEVAGLGDDVPGNPVGNTMVPYWNNLYGASGQVVGVRASTGETFGNVVVTWGAAGIWSLPNTTGGTNTTANVKMMKGYLDNPDEKEIEIHLSGLFPVGDSYSLVVYTDGDNGNFYRGAGFIISQGWVFQMIEDTEGQDFTQGADFNSGAGVNPNGLFQLPSEGGTPNQIWPVYPQNNYEGNTLVFTNLTSSYILLKSWPIWWGGPEGSEVTGRSPINGIQIVGVIPEPWSVGFLLVTALTFACRHQIRRLMR